MLSFFIDTPFTIMQYSLFAFARDLKGDFFAFSVVRQLTRRPPPLPSPPTGYALYPLEARHFHGIIEQNNVFALFSSARKASPPLCIVHFDGLASIAGQLCIFFRNIHG